MSEKKALVKIDAKEYGLEESKAKDIIKAFVPVIEQMHELEPEFNSIKAMEISEDTCALAKKLRHKYVKVRTGSGKIHKAEKAFYLSGGRYIDAWKNAHLGVTTEIESTLKGIEEHYINIEKARIVKLEAERIEQLTPYGYISAENNINVGEINDQVWPGFLAGVKKVYADKLKEEMAIEAKRIADAKAIEAEKAKTVAAESAKQEAVTEAKEAKSELADAKSELADAKTELADARKPVDGSVVCPFCHAEFVPQS